MRLILSLPIFLILLASCTAPPDVPACRKLTGQLIVVKDQFGIPSANLRPNPECLKQIGEAECGFCVWSITNKTRFVGEDKKYWLYGKPWSKLLGESILLPTESYASIKTYIINNCKKNQDCNADIGKWRIKLDSLDGIVKPKP